MLISLLFSSFLLFINIDAKGSPPSLKPTWIREKEALMESKLVPPPHSPSPLPKRRPHPSSITKKDVAPSLRSTIDSSPSKGLVSSKIPPTTPSTPLPSHRPSLPVTKEDVPVIRSFGRVQFIDGRPKWTLVKEETLFRGKKTMKSVRTRREGRGEGKEGDVVPPIQDDVFHTVEWVTMNAPMVLEMEDGRVTRSRRKREIARRSISSPSFNRYVSKDGSTVVTTSNSDTDDILVVMQGTSPMTTSVFSNADRKMKKVYEDALDEVKDVFNQVGSSLVKDLPQVEQAFNEAKSHLNKKMDDLKDDGSKVRKETMRRGIEMVSMVDENTENTMKDGLKDYLVYDNSLVMMDGLLYSMPTLYSIVQSATTPIQNSVEKMHGAVENYVTESLSGLRDKMPPLANTTMEIEKKMKELLKDLTDKTNKKISGMVSYETLDAINDMNGAESQAISVIQTGPGFSYVTLSSSAPSFSNSLNGTEERAKSAIEEYKKQLQPYVNGQMLDPHIFGNVPAHGEKTKSTNELLDQLSHEVDDYLHKEHPKSSVEAAKQIQSKPEEKQKLNEAMENATLYAYVPMLYNGWYTLAPVAFTQASDLAVSASNQLNSIKGKAVNYAYSLLMDIFGQYRWALLPIQEATSNMTQSGSNIDSKVQETLPLAIAQATVEMPKEKKVALQQIVYYYVPSYPFFV